MNDCDLCGKPTGTIYVVEIEGAMMNLCERCARGKTPVQVIGEPAAERRQASPRKPAAEEAEIVADYGRRIRSAREGMGMTSQVLAEKINEKESTLVRVEKQEMLPNETLRKKLEHELGVRLIDDSPKGRESVHIGKPEPLSLWDAAVRKEKK